jgi:hypothetical protein
MYIKKQKIFTALLYIFWCNLQVEYIHKNSSLGNQTNIETNLFVLNISLIITPNKDLKVNLLSYNQKTT